MEAFFNKTKNPIQEENQTIKYFTVGLIALAYIFGSFVPLFETDPAHHANIALRMYLTGDFWSLYDIGKPYMDKPHLLFWTAAISFKLFGVNTLAYKLPTLLTSILGTYATYKLGSELYNKKVGETAALLLASSFAFTLANSDVRMDGMLASFMIFAFWQMVMFQASKSWKSLILTALGLALAFMTKGMIGPAVPTIIFFFYILEKKDWKILASYKLWLIIPAFFIFISPSLYGYYTQFDLHPELEIRGTTGNSGVYFILWGQNFERFGGGEFGSDGGQDPFFFLHTSLWSLIPWSILFFTAFIYVIKRVASREKGLIWSIWAGITLLITIYSMSSFKLPHYIITLIPFMALMTADFLDSIKLSNVWKRVNLGLILLVAVLVLILNIYFFPMSILFGILVTVIAGLSIWLIKNVSNQEQHFLFSLVILGAFINILLQGNFYPKVLQYQAGDNLAKTAKEAKIPNENVYFYGVHSFAFDYYTAYLHKHIDEDELEQKLNEHKVLYLYTMDPTIDQLLQSDKWSSEIIAQSVNFHVSRLKGEFINPKTRENAIDNRYLVKISE
ncbi:glycosyltransferase family 39 protein [Belliella sp. DSM 111904]|uniref:Glycosyltransferase family 39 protein n=1 Tax=Belliella filtrata TaxID=2923435 RepID=A0ABS9V2J8_9BACT|nr:glycosyltransferase family 39 protein [Belliella filtrata]MCH7410647.1 glycosyltransferase family 39 protein [Belliella filtrata]